MYGNFLILTEFLCKKIKTLQADKTKWGKSTLLYKIKQINFFPICHGKNEFQRLVRIWK